MALIFAALCVPSVGHAADYYVAPGGRDGASGTSPGSAWRTIARVNRARLAPGDTVNFRAGATFDDAALVPRTSGAARRPIRFRSYGQGRAILRRGAWLRERHHLVLERLTFDSGRRGPSYVGHGISGAVSGRGSPYLTVRNCLIRRWRLGINLPNVGDRGWVIRHNVIEATADSGILIEDGTVTNGRGPSGTLIEGNTIRDTGLGQFEFGLHGIYTRGPRTTIRGNRILRFRDSGVSFRFQNTTIENNVISGGREGITWFPYASRAGTTRIAYNRVLGASEAALFIDEAQRQIEAPRETRESFVIVNNTFLTPATASGVTVKPGKSPRVVFANNIVAGPRNILFRVDQRPRTYVEKNNLWYSGGGEKWLYVGQAFSSLERLRSASSQATGDVVGDPRLGERLMPAAGSPAVDAGGTLGGTYRRTCVGAPFSYCGRAPDIGAVERRARAGG